MIIMSYVLVSILNINFQQERVCHLKKIFVTVGAKLLPCERIGSDFSFGEVNEIVFHLI